MKRSAVFTPPFELAEERLGPLPIVNHFPGLRQMERLLDAHVPTKHDRSSLPSAKALGVLIRSVTVEREPMCRHYESVSGFWPPAFGLSSRQAKKLTEDQLGRALDRLFGADVYGKTKKTL